MTANRVSYFTRWPDETEGPLYVGTHWNDRGGETVLVGVEVWTEAPGEARSSLGPGGSVTDDLLPWPAAAVTAEDLASLRLADLVGRFVHALAVAPQGPLLGPVSVPRAGRRPTYQPTHWAEVAAVYAQAVTAGRRDPSRAVAEALTLSTSTARKHVHRARGMGLIGS